MENCEEVRASEALTGGSKTAQLLRDGARPKCFTHVSPRPPASSPPPNKALSQMLACVFVRACVSLWFNACDRVCLRLRPVAVSVVRLDPDAPTSPSPCCYLPVFSWPTFSRRTTRPRRVGVTMHLESTLVPGQIIRTIRWTFRFATQDSINRGVSVLPSRELPLWEFNVL